MTRDEIMKACRELYSCFEFDSLSSVEKEFIRCVVTLTWSRNIVEANLTNNRGEFVKDFDLIQNISYDLRQEGLMSEILCDEEVESRIKMIKENTFVTVTMAATRAVEKLDIMGVILNKD